jgi:hypothetical protein
MGFKQTVGLQLIVFAVKQARLSVVFCVVQTRRRGPHRKHSTALLTLPRKRVYVLLPTQQATRLPWGKGLVDVLLLSHSTPFYF